MSEDTGQRGPERSPAPPARDADTIELSSSVGTDGDGPSDLGTRVARYLVLGEAGRGAMGRVLRAYDPKLQREVALKEVRSRSLGAEGTRRLVTEARAMAKLSHPNVVAAYDVEELADGQVVVVMEYVDGRTLSEWLKESHPWQEIVACFRTAGRGLAAAHAAGLLHRDFKPGNVLVAEPAVKVTDFGLAKIDDRATRSLPGRISGDEDGGGDGEVSGPTSQALTETGIVMGTPRYMAPEQHRGETLTPAADQYAYCIALWEALCGAPPFPGPRLAEAKAKGPPAWPGAPVPRPIVNAIARGLSPDPDRRWPSMDALLGALAHDPARRRRRWLKAGAVAVVLVPSTVGLRAWADGLAQRCAETSATEHLQGAWDEPLRARVKEAMLQIDASYANAAWLRTEESLDAYALQWTRMHVDACEATNVRGEQSDAVMDLRMACLHRAKVELAAATHVLSQADAKTVQKAGALTSGLPPLARCAEVEALEADEEPPLHADAEAVEASRDHLAAAKAARASGHYDEARRRLAAARESLTDVHYDPVEIEAALEEGILLAHTGNYAESEAALRGVLRLGSKRHRWAAVQDAAATLLSVVGYWQHRPDEAAAYWDLALGLADRDPEREARAHNNLGLVLQAQGKFAEAEGAYRRAVALKERIMAADDPDVASSRGNLAIMLDAQGKHAEAEAELRRVVAILEAVLGADHPYVAMFHNNLAASLDAQGKHAEAEVELRIALAVKEKALGLDHPDLATTLDNLASGLLEQGKPDDAEPHVRRALALRQKALGPDHPATASSHQTLALIMEAQKRYEEAEAEHRRAIAMRVETLGPDHPELARSRQNLASVLKNLGRYAEAEQELRSALAALEQALGPDHPRVAGAQYALASVLLKRGAIRDARELAEAAWARHASGDVPAVARGTAAFVLAEVCWASSEPADRNRAIALAERALADFEGAGDAGTGRAETARAWLQEHGSR